jgi:hypothetical protein
MAVVIRNLLTSRPLMVPLTTGAMVRLSPGQAVELPEIEIRDNAKVEKLQGQGVLEIEAGGAGESTTEPPTGPAASGDTPGTARSRKGAGPVK